MELDELINTKFLSVQNPVRYIGGEFQTKRKNLENCEVKCAMGYADLYEIGMSNSAVRIIFNQLNKIDKVFCDRVFSVAPDAETLLRENKQKLFTLDKRIELDQLDLLALTMGSELCITNVLQILDLGGMEIESKNRKPTDPIVILGGPTVTNPAPFGPFVDFIFIGESETHFEKVAEVLKKYKNKSERILELRKLNFLWWEGKNEVTKKSLDDTFCDRDKTFEYFVVPSYKIAQDDGNVEIMRGCPNGCRFCHAGQYYKPLRQRSLDTIYDMVNQNVETFGYREVTLSSLSSGDFPHLMEMIKAFNNEFGYKHISFSLPSLKVGTFSLDVLEQLSSTRRSGLTFAVETPKEDWQKSVNKIVENDRIIQIITEAKARGWKKAKFYFMTGIPFTNIKEEQEGIVDYLKKIYAATHININLNIATFIPKPHTPFQWVAQQKLETSISHLKSIKIALQREIRGIKVSYHEPSVTYVEGLFSRGDANMAKLIKAGYEKGCRLDAWEDYFEFEKWQTAIKEMDFNPEESIYTNYDLDHKFPWENIDLIVEKDYLKAEYLNAKNQKLTSACAIPCDHKCGVCNTGNILRLFDENSLNEFKAKHSVKKKLESNYTKFILTYQKINKATYLSHINTMRNFEMAFLRAQIDLRFTEGFNPKPRLEFLNPLSLGVSGEKELVLVEIDVTKTPIEEQIRKLNENFCEGYKIVEYKIDTVKKKTSLAARMDYSIFQISNIKNSEITQCLENFSDTPIMQVTSLNKVYTIKIQGEKNLFKTIFPDLNKFDIAQTATIIRKEIKIKE